MKLYLFNFTDGTLSVTSGRSEHAAELSVLPNASAVVPTGKANFKLTSVGASPKITLEKVSLTLEVERQYVVNPKKSSPFGWSHISMPEDCPWRIYRDQVASLILSHWLNAHERMP
jgi:hypothetical protein